jgi:hypothetical protein
MSDEELRENLTVPRDIWQVRPQTVAELDEVFGERGHGRACKAMRHINFAGADDEPVGDELRAAWRDTLARDGKLRDTDEHP